MRGFDTHIHTTASDGLCTVSEIISLARGQALRGIAVTDHDTVGALPKAALLSEMTGFPIIPGIELSAEFQDHDVHILGYFIDYKCSVLLQALDELQESRSRRIEQMLQLLDGHEMPLKITDLHLESGQAAGRPHIARAMVQKHYVRDEKEAFTKWLGRGLPCYTERAKLSPLYAIELIKRAGGIPCLAHPGLGVPLTLIIDLIEGGLQAIEIYHPEHNSNDEVKYYGIAKEYGLIYLGGSDFHGTGDKTVGLKFSSMEQVELLYMRAGRSI